MELSSVREDRDGRTKGESVVAPAAWLGSQVREGYTLKASKREANLKIRSPIREGVRPLVDYQVDRPEVQVQQCMQLTGTNRSRA